MMKTFDARTVARWRAWLAAHQASESEVWLIFHKQHTGKPSVPYLDALDEALCFGWIDGVVRSLDNSNPRSSGRSKKQAMTTIEIAIGWATLVTPTSWP